MPNDNLPDNACDAYPAHTCSEAISCRGANCGAGEPFSKEGCLRSTCESDKDCGEKERCYRAEDFDGCESSNITCEDGEDGSCQCGQTDDCGGAYCIPEDEFPAQQCEGYPAHSCIATVDCASQPCGDLKPFTNKGCLRTSCTSDDDCASGQSCFKAEDWGECASSTIFCDEDETTLQCSCGSTDDCGGAYCVDTHAVPSICEQHTSADSCVANNHPESLYACAWLDAVQVDIKSKSCEATVPSGRCVAMYNVGDGCSENPNCGDYPRSYAQPGSEWILRNTADCGMEPLGWEQCAEGSSEPACLCACPE